MHVTHVTSYEKGVVQTDFATCRLVDEVTMLTAACHLGV